MMKKALGTLAVLALLVVVSLASYPATNDTNEKGSSEPASVTTKACTAPLNSQDGSKTQH